MEHVVHSLSFSFRETAFISELIASGAIQNRFGRAIEV